MKKNIAGQVFGRLIAVAPTGGKRWSATLWSCACSCGKTHVAAVNTLIAGGVRSCGCLRDEVAAAKAYSHGLYKTPAYRSWDAMIQRCTNSNNPNYEKYGAVGIRVCARWRDSSNFLQDMGPRPEGTTLDRIDPRGDYEPGNCRWAGKYTQARNKVKRITTYASAEQARALHSAGVGPKEISKRLGMSETTLSGVLYLRNVSVEGD